MKLVLCSHHTVTSGPLHPKNHRIIRFFRSEDKVVNRSYGLHMTLFTFRQKTILSAATCKLLPKTKKKARSKSSKDVLVILVVTVGLGFVRALVVLSLCPNSCGSKVR